MLGRAGRPQYDDRGYGCVIKQNAERLLKALEHIFQNYSSPSNAATVKNTNILIRYGIPDEAEPLLQIRSIDIKTVITLTQHGIKNMQELAIQTPQMLKAIGINEKKAKSILRDLEKYQTDYLQQKLIPDENMREGCLVKAESKTVKIACEESIY